MQWFDKLTDYTKYLDNLNQHFSLKIMGQKSSSSFYTATMLADIYAQTDNPDFGVSAQAPFGQIRKRGVILQPEKIFSQIISPNESINLFQGDLIEFESAGKISQNLKGSHKFSMIISHSCDLANAPFFVVSPIFLESELTLNVMNELRVKFFSSQRDADVLKQNWFRNEILKIISFPAPPVGEFDEQFITPLNLFTTVVGQDALDFVPKLRLKYRALAFLQWRLAAVYMRDVQRSDATREF